jgi:hypothetical protein
VAPDYTGPFPFTDTITRVQVDIRSKISANDVAAIARTEAAKE